MTLDALIEQRAQRRAARRSSPASSCASSLTTTASLSSGSLRSAPVRVSIEKSTRAASSSGSRDAERDHAVDVHVLEVGAARRRSRTAARGRRAAPRRCEAPSGANQNASAAPALRERARSCRARSSWSARRAGGARTNTNESQPWCAPFTRRLTSPTATRESIQLGRAMHDLALVRARRFEQPRRQHAAAERVLVHRLAAHRLVHLLQLAQRELRRAGAESRPGV